LIILISFTTKICFGQGAYNKEESLDAHCIGIVENINRQLKEHGGLKCSLAEYLFRTIHFSSQFNKDNMYYDLVKSNPFLIHTKEHLSNFGITKLVINMMKSMNYIPTSQNLYTLIKADDPNVKYTLIKKGTTLECPCSFILMMKMSCEHILRILTQERKESDVLNYFSL